jgi:hypothetical protein
VLEGTKREIIIDTLTADYRGMTVDDSNQLLEELFAANGGEFKKENRNGYLLAILLLLIGCLGAGFLFFMLSTGEWKIKFLFLAAVSALFGIGKGLSLLTKSLRGKYRENHSPF